ncbi:hypothetical protein SEMRO_149_G068580.1 [Seminavis robusta]|uniref:Uncharacterized protein n=1 Tax=Seminavis robusta TaxID=568900 RepID=A0A9N8DLF2_9STRA|nr:hypothetical protein SEMRO_149_G068580.1 [Seminavis robusta]|eukprot:Sro149_g068580.1 n/a (323) ;mRNA; r:73184-74387
MSLSKQDADHLLNLHSREQIDRIEKESTTCEVFLDHTNFSVFLEFKNDQDQQIEQLGWRFEDAENYGRFGPTVVTVAGSFETIQTDIEAQNRAIEEILGYNNSQLPDTFVGVQTVNIPGSAMLKPVIYEPELGVVYQYFDSNSQPIAFIEARFSRHGDYSAAGKVLLGPRFQMPDGEHMNDIMMWRGLPNNQEGTEPIVLQARNMYYTSVLHQMKRVLSAKECPTADDEVIDYLNREMSTNPIMVMVADKDKKRTDTTFQHGDIKLSDLMFRLAYPEGLVGCDDCTKRLCGHCKKPCESGDNGVWCKSCKTLYCNRECANAD